MGEEWNQDVSPSAKVLSLYTLRLYSGRGFALSEGQSYVKGKQA